METKKIIAVGIFVIVVVTGGFILYWQREALLNSTKNITRQNQNQEETIILENKTITDIEKPFNISITYPYVEGLDEFNEKSEKIVNKELSEFKKISLENDQAVKKIDPESYTTYPREYYLNIEYDKGLINNEIISTVLNISNFTGGAHGANYFVTLNYNIINKKEIKLADLFLDQPDYLQKISIFCTEALTRQIKEKVGDDGGSWLETGAGPSLENFSIFLINKDSITFYFPQYQVAAYALGAFKVEMPYTK